MDPVPYTFLYTYACVKQYLYYIILEDLISTNVIILCASFCNSFPVIYAFEIHAYIQGKRKEWRKEEERRTEREGDTESKIIPFNFCIV